ncbi:MAG: HAMP domain-containing sensor histidine kinase [Candidatus Giovannonibacteria bacterium]|nr:HAMP domain-containing sensor histidine kinase [Candidatus Giovannonibacteria bacterium]
MAGRFVESLNLKKTCAEYRVGLWQCPQFLFLVMGAIIILAILVTYIVASRYEEPEIAALAVLVLTAILFAIGNLIVRAFEQVALSSRSKSEFISIMSHQLRSPLSAVKWQVDFLLADAQKRTQDAASVQKYLQTVYDQNERMIRSVNDLLEVNRIEDDDLVLRPSVFSILETTNKIAGEYKSFAAASNVNIEVSVAGLAPTLYADEERIRHVMEHLLDNAIRYSPKGGKVSINISVEGGKLVWKITDQGAGIPPKDQKRIFEKFFRSDHALRYQTEGSGVGLFIAKSIIKKSGGEVGFASSLDQGSMFWFTLPI